jgi:transcriptional regulator with XRE-family HTH domain
VREDGDPLNFGKTLRRYRWVAGLTQEELARESGLSVRAVSDIERGHTSRPYARTIRMLADALNLDEPARARLMSAVHDREEEAAGERQEWVARWDGADVRTAGVRTAPAAPDEAGAAPTDAAGDDGSPWPRPRRARWARVTAASAAAALAALAALAGGVAGWAMVSHAPVNPPAASGLQPSGLLAPVSEGTPRSVARCEQGTADLTSSLVRGSNGTFWGTVEVQYSYRCDAVWTHFDPSPAVSGTKAVTVTLEIISKPGGKYQLSRASGTDQPQRTDMLLLRAGCAQASVILLKLGRELASATTACQPPP